jgi:hypothetical protein
MPCLYSDSAEFYRYYSLFELENHVPEWKMYKSDEAKKLLCDRAAGLDGQVSVSHFIHAFQQLKDEGAIKPLRKPAPVVNTHELTVQEYRSIPAAVTVQRYRMDPEFRAGVDSLIERKLI